MKQEYVDIKQIVKRIDKGAARTIRSITRRKGRK